MMRPGKYRAINQTTVERCHGNGGENAARVIEYVTYEPGEEFEVPASVNGYFHRTKRDGMGILPEPKYERIDG